MDETTTDVRTELELTDDAARRLSDALGLARMDARKAQAHGDLEADEDPVTPEEISDLVRRFNSEEALTVDARDLTVLYDALAAYRLSDAPVDAGLERLEGAVMAAEEDLEAAEDDERVLQPEDVDFDAHAVAQEWLGNRGLTVRVAAIVTHEFTDTVVLRSDGVASDGDVVFQAAEVLVEEKAVGVCPRETAEKFAPLYVDLDRGDDYVLALNPAQVMPGHAPPLPDGGDEDDEEDPLADADDVDGEVMHDVARQFGLGTGAVKGALRFDAPASEADVESRADEAALEARRVQARRGADDEADLGAKYCTECGETYDRFACVNSSHSSTGETGCRECLTATLRPIVYQEGDERTHTGGYIPQQSRDEAITVQEVRRRLEADEA